MLEFFRKAAKVYFLLFFWLFMIGDVFIGIAAGNIAASVPRSPSDLFSPSSTSNEPNVIVIIITTVILWLATIFVFSLFGAFLDMCENVAAIRKKLVSNIAIPTKQISNESENDEEDFENDGMWKCKKCNCFNDTSSIFCIYCGEQKLSDININDSDSSVDSANQIESKYWQCIKCGQTNDDTYKFCGNCGSPKP